jgi:hypothetical protein
LSVFSTVRATFRRFSLPMTQNRDAPAMRAPGHTSHWPVLKTLDRAARAHIRVGAVAACSVGHRPRHFGPPGGAKPAIQDGEGCRIS